MKFISEALTLTNSKSVFCCYLVGGQDISRYEQKYERTQNSKPKQIRINQHLGAQIWKHEMPYIKLELPDTPTRALNKLAKAHTSPCMA